MNLWDWPPFWDDLTRLGVATLLGGLIGLEREWKGHWAGLRTHMMVSVGCAIFVIAGVSLAKNEGEAVSRIIQGIASGIGFLGAGTILKLDQKQQIKGLTTASSIWLSAALGTAAGLGEYALAVASATVSLFILGVLGPIEKILERHQAKNRKERDEIDAKKAERKLEHENE
jgi:putative Mg2+ transporter-C (MgtC) family protein